MFVTLPELGGIHNVLRFPGIFVKGDLITFLLQIKQNDKFVCRLFLAKKICCIYMYVTCNLL